MTDDDLVTQRKKKIAIWEALGFSGYANGFSRSHNFTEAIDYCKNNTLRVSEKVMNEPQIQAKLAGRIINVREMGGLTFMRLQDQQGDFQICLTKKRLKDNYKTWLKALDIGDYLGVEGEFFLTKHQEPTLLAENITPLSKAWRPLPEKWAGLQDREVCYRQRNLDLIANKQTRERFLLRSDLVKALREWHWDHDFIEVETTVLQQQAGGALAEVFRTQYQALDHDFVLRIALELELKMICSGGIERVFEIGKCFRNEGIDPSHLPEFSMVEWYAAYEDLSQNQIWTEEYLRFLVTKVLQQSTVTIFDKNEDEHKVDFSQPFAKATFTELLKEHANLNLQQATEKEILACAKKHGVETHANMSKGGVLDAIYKKTARPHLIHPTFVYGYPSELKPLAIPKADGTAECFQLLVGGWELVNSYGELINPAIQRRLLQEQAAAKQAGNTEAMDMDESFVRAMEHGFPPMTGSGMGIDRLCTLLTQQKNLRDLVFFPVMKSDQK